MDEQIKQIAERLRGLRDVLELTAEDIARECDISAEDSKVKVLVIPTNEELVIARDTERLAK